MTTIFNSPEEMKDAVGQHLGFSDWLEITQERINQFADSTGDHQWIHVDAVKAKDGPFGICIAHGFLTLSLCNFFLPQIVDVRWFKSGINYGCDRVRFPAPVPVGSRIRASGEMIKIEEMKDGGIQSTVRITVEIFGQEKPACVTDTISCYYGND